VVRSVSSFPLEFSPGEKFSYSNTGYFLLGLIIEKVSGTTYGDFLGERIFGPLGMTATRLNDFKPIIANRASGYTLDGDQLRNADAWSPTWPYAAGGLISSVVDMARWEKALADGTLLSEESREQMWRRAELSNGRQSDYALGWGIGEFRGRKLIGHSGGIAGFSTDISRFVDDQVTVIVLANSDRANAARLARGIAAFYIPALNDRKVQPLEDKQPEVTAMIRKILEQSVAGAEVDQSLFTDAARKDIFPDRFKQASAHLRALGRLTGFVLIERSEHDGQTTLVYQATFGESDVRCTVVLTMAGKIAGLRLIPE
jgi:CubicO group peptidase (beta-lactamase class C family)